MAGVRLRWTVFGDEIIDRELLRFSERAVSDMRPAYIAIVKDIKDATREQFAQEGGRGTGGAWPALSPEYAAWKGAQDFSPGTILRATNEMYEALTAEAHPDQVLLIEGQGLTFGATGFSGLKGYWHQQGSGNLPVRKIFDFTELDKSTWVKQLQRYIVSGELGPGAIV